MYCWARSVQGRSKEPQETAQGNPQGGGNHSAGRSHAKELEIELRETRGTLAALKGRRYRGEQSNSSVSSENDSLESSESEPDSRRRGACMIPSAPPIEGKGKSLMEEPGVRKDGIPTTTSVVQYVNPAKPAETA